MEDESTISVINQISEVWEDWLTPEAKAEFLEKSFYSMKASDHPKAPAEFKKKMEGVRVLGLNMQTCYYFNFFLFEEFGGELGEIDWLEKTLLEMEKNKEKAIIMGHIPPGSESCLGSYSRRFYGLMERF